YALLAVVGVGTAVGSFVVYERADATATEAATAELELLCGQTQSAPSERVKATTDRGTLVALHEVTAARDGGDLNAAEERILRDGQLDGQVIHRGPPDDRSNCHGWVFTGGRFILPGAQVDLVLKENGYQEV